MTTTGISIGRVFWLGIVLPLTVLACWVAVTLFMARGLVQQRESQTWPTAQGQIVSSQIVEKRGSKGRRYKVTELEYTFAIAGQTRTGKKVRMNSPPASFPSQKYRALAMRYPVGTPVIVSYDPLDPSHTVLEPGAIPTDYLSLSIPIFSAGFAAAMIALCLAGAFHRPPGWASGVRVWDEPTPGVRLAQMGPIAYAGFWAGALGFVLFLVYALSMPGTHAMWGVIVTWVWPVIVFAGAWVYRRTNLASGKHDLTIDLANAMVSIPACHGRTENVQVAIESITGIATLNDGAKTKYGRQWRLHLMCPSSFGSDSLPILQTQNQSGCKELEAWLRERLALDAV